MSIAVVCQPRCGIMHFEITFIFLIKPFSYMSKKSRQKFEYLENEKSIFKGISVAKSGLRPESAPLIKSSINKNFFSLKECEISFSIYCANRLLPENVLEIAFLFVKC